jgi:hypothetical protein
VLLGLVKYNLKIINSSINLNQKLLALTSGFRDSVKICVEGLADLLNLEVRSLSLIENLRK